MYMLFKCFENWRIVPLFNLMPLNNIQSSYISDCKMESVCILSVYASPR